MKAINFTDQELESMIEMYTAEMEEAQLYITQIQELLKKLGATPGKSAWSGGAECAGMSGRGTFHFPVICFKKSNHRVAPNAPKWVALIGPKRVALIGPE